MSDKTELLKLLQQRVSIPRVKAPAPDPESLQAVFKAAVRAADHGKLQPWRFLTISDAALVQLGDVFVEAGKRKNADISPSLLEKFKNMPLRAPMIIVAIAKCQEHPSVPRQEQILACGAAVQNMLNAFFILGYGAVWRSGEMTSDTYVRNKLGVSDNEEIIGFIYVGTPEFDVPMATEIDVNQFFTAWLPN